MTESKVDALAVLDREIAAIKNTKEMVDFAMSADRWVAYADHLFSLNNTRAAVAELIEAATEHSEFFAHYSSVNESCQDDMAEERNRVLDRLRAALAACTPAKGENQ